MRSLSRIVAILEAVASSGDGLQTAQIAVKTGLPISTTSRLLTSLQDFDIIRQNDSERFVIGSLVLSLARIAAEQNEIFARARPFMSDLRDLTGETVSLHVPFQDKRVCIGEVRSKHPVSRVVPPGEVMPLIGTATGEVLLVDHPDDDIRALLAAQQFSKREIESVIERVHAIREQDWAFVDTWTDGVGALSTPIRSGGRTIAALTLSGPSYRFGVEEVRTFVADVIATARKTSGDLSDDLSNANTTTA